MTPTVEEIIARAYDREEAAQMGEPSPWSIDDKDPDWVDGRLHCGRAAIAALDAAGFVIAPKEPTEAMLTASYHALGNHIKSLPAETKLNYKGHERGVPVTPEYKATIRYRAMLAARPQSPSGGER